MPELPEVETIRRHLAPYVEGRILEALEVLDERWCRPLAPEELAAAVEGRRHDGPFADVGASVLRWLTDRDAPGMQGEPFVP